MSISVEVDPAFSGLNQIHVENIINTVFEKEGFTADNVSLVFGNDDYIDCQNTIYLSKNYIMILRLVLFL